MEIIEFIIAIITILFVYSSYKEDNLKSALGFRIIIFIISCLISYFTSTSGTLNLGAIFTTGIVYIIIYALINLIYIVILNYLEYFVAFRLTIGFIGYIIVCFALELYGTILLKLILLIGMKSLIHV